MVTMQAVKRLCSGLVRRWDHICTTYSVTFFQIASGTRYAIFTHGLRTAPFNVGGAGIALIPMLGSILPINRDGGLTQFITLLMSCIWMAGDHTRTTSDDMRHHLMNPVFYLISAAWSFCA
jgi:hypothetical protein